MENKVQAKGSTRIQSLSQEVTDIAQGARLAMLAAESGSLPEDHLVIRHTLPGVYCQGIQYYDFKNVKFLNNTDMARLIDLLKTLIAKGVNVQFVNVNEKVKNKIKSMGLEQILNYREIKKVE